MLTTLTIPLIIGGVAVATTVTVIGVKKGWFKKKNPTAAAASGKTYGGPADSPVNAPTDTTGGA